MDDCLQLLREKKCRITGCRKEILTVLKTTPCTALELFQKLKAKKLKVDLVTIYRNLELFGKLGIVGKTSFDNKSGYFEIILNKKHHHHLICETCGLVEDVFLDEKLIVSRVEKQSGFRVLKHNLEFFGRCQKCSIKN